jgi:hypothetical protein
MTDKKVNLQDLFDEQTTKHVNSMKVVGKEGKEKLRQANIGKTLTEETRAKMSAVRKGRPHSESHRDALTASNKARAGTPFEQAHRDNQSKAAKERWATNPYKPSAEVIEKRRQACLKTNAEKRAAMPPKEVKPPKKRGRPPKVSSH